MGFVEDTLAAPRPDALAALEFAATAAVLPFTGFLARSGWLDRQLPGFGPFGTAGAHCFDPSHPLYLRIAAIAAVSADYPGPPLRPPVPAASRCVRRALRSGPD